MDIHKDCYSAINLTQQGGPHRRKTFDLRKGEVLAILGANGAGKSSVGRALMGMVPIAGGRIRFRGQDINAFRPGQRIVLGLAYAPEGRRVFGDLTVHEN
jgi:branched-chain amino acid transport system ATP-binding protein